MSSTVENIHNNIIAKIAGLKKIARHFYNPKATVETVYDMEALECCADINMPTMVWCSAEHSTQDSIDYISTMRSIPTRSTTTRLINKPFCFVSSSTARYIPCAISSRPPIVHFADEQQCRERAERVCQITWETVDCCEATYGINSTAFILAFKNSPSDATYTAYIKYLIAENIIATLDACHAELKEFYSVAQESDDIDYYTQAAQLRNYTRRASRVSQFSAEFNDMLEEFRADLVAYDETACSIAVTEESDARCVCGTAYSVDQQSCEYICRKCGVSEKLYGVVFEDEQHGYQDNQRSKHGSHDPIKHCKVWLDRIQAIENKVVDPCIINSIKKKIWQDNIWADQITCATIRRVLKKIKLTAYNDHVPLIRRIITGYAPPLLTDQERRMVYMDFSLATDIYNGIKPSDKVNCPYNPYFLYRILERRINGADQLRKRQILECIHLQSHETTTEHSKIWDVIAQRMEEFRTQKAIK
jgi:hypothetical protein